VALSGLNGRPQAIESRSDSRQPQIERLSFMTLSGYCLLDLGQKLGVAITTPLFGSAGDPKVYHKLLLWTGPRRECNLSLIPTFLWRVALPATERHPI
jgi:hypothetical protein